MSAADTNNSMRDQIAAWVHEDYWVHEDNCATTMMNSLAKLFSIEISADTLAAAVGMHGAGGYQAQCGLVEGALMFMGVFGSRKGLRRETVVQFCYDFAKTFDVNFTSLSCSDLRPGGFKEEDPPHPCEQLSVEVIWFTYQWLLGMEERYDS